MMTSTKLKQLYPDINKLREYANETFKHNPDKIIYKNYLLPQSYTKITHKRFEDLNYNELTNVVLYFQKEKIKKDEERINDLKEKKIGRMSDVKAKNEFNVNYNYNYPSDDNNIIWWILILLLFIIIIFAVIKRSK